jgi:outer membrane protein assembly factor BamB
VTDDAVLVAAGRTVGAVESSSGAQRWSERTAAEVADVAVLRDVMVVSVPDGLAGYDVSTGAERWTLTDEVVGVAGLVAGREHVYAVARDVGGLVVSAIDPADGAIEPLTTIADEAASGRPGRTVLGFDPSDKKGGPTLYVLTRDQLQALDPQDGTVRWSATVASQDGADARGQEPHLLARPWVESFDVAAGASFVVGRDGSVCRYASDSGEAVWTICETFPGELPPAPSLDARSGRVIVASSDALAAYDFTTGQLLWDQASPDQPSLAVASGPKLAYVAREAGVVQAIDHESGRLQWRAQDIGDVTALTADAEGVYVGAADGSIVRLLEQNVAKVDVQ